MYCVLCWVGFCAVMRCYVPGLSRCGLGMGCYGMRCSVVWCYEGWFSGGCVGFGGLCHVVLCCVVWSVVVSILSGLGWV